MIHDEALILWCNASYCHWFTKIIVVHRCLGSLTYIYRFTASPWFIDSLAHWFTASPIRWFTASLVQWCSKSVIYCFIESLLRWFRLIHCFIDWLIDWQIDWFIVRLNHWLTASFLHRFTDSLIHGFIDSSIHRPMAHCPFSQLCMDSFMLFHWHLNHHLLIRWCASQLQHFVASVSTKTLQKVIFSQKLLFRLGAGRARLLGT